MASVLRPLYSFPHLSRCITYIFFHILPFSLLLCIKYPCSATVAAVELELPQAVHVTRLQHATKEKELGPITAFRQYIGPIIEHHFTGILIVMCLSRTCTPATTFSYVRFYQFRLI